MPRKRVMSKTQGGIIGLLVIVLLAICGIFYSLTGIDAGGLFSGSPTPSLEVADTLPPVVGVTGLKMQLSCQPGKRAPRPHVARAAGAGLA